MFESVLPKIVDHDARRRDFIEAAYETILEEGMAKTTVRAVAKRAGYTTGALVHYFADKDELIQEVLEVNGAVVRERMEQAVATHRGRAALREVLIEALPTTKRQGSSWRIWLAMWYHSEESETMRTEERKRYKEWVGRIQSLLAQAVEMQELPMDADTAAEAKLLVALVDGIGVQYLLASGRLPAKQIIRILDSYLRRLFV